MLSQQFIQDVAHRIQMDPHELLSVINHVRAETPLLVRMIHTASDSFSVVSNDEAATILGEMGRNSDGVYVFLPEKSLTGFWQAHILHAVAGLLDAVNWYEQIAHDPGTLSRSSESPEIEDVPEENVVEIHPGAELVIPYPQGVQRYNQGGYPNESYFD